MESDRSGAIFILLNIFVFSFFPLISSISRDLGADVFGVALFAQISGALFSLAFGYRVVRVRSFVSDIRSNFSLLLPLSMASLFLHIFFLYSMEYTSGISATIVLELWPLFAFFFAGMIVRKRWSGFSFKVFLLFLLSSFGVVCLSFIDTFGGGAPSVVGMLSDNSVGLALALLASACSGLTVAQAEFFRRIGVRFDFFEAAYSIFIFRFISLPISLIIALAFGEGLLETKNIVLGAAFGFTSYGLASILAVQGVAYSKSLSNILLWYLAPFVGGVWLVVFTDTVVFDLHLIALFPILLSNLLIGIESTDRKSYFIMNVCAVFGVLYIYLGPTLPSEQYYDALGPLVAFYAIVVSFILQRKIGDMRSIAIIIARTVAEGRSRGVMPRDAIARLEKQLVLRSSIGSDCLELESEARGDARLEELQAVDEILAERETSSSLGDAAILVILTVSIAFIGIVLRPLNFVSDLVALSVVVSAGFLTAFTIEASSHSFQWRLAQGIFTEHRDQVMLWRKKSILSMLNLVILFLLFLLLIVDRHWVDLFQNLRI